MESLSDKLKSLGVTVGAHNLPPPKPVKKGHPIESVVQGDFDCTPFGDTFVVTQDYAGDYQHGIMTLCSSVDPTILNECCRCNIVEDVGLDRYIFLDTETSGLSGGTGTYAFLIGLGYRTANGFRLVQLFMRDPGHETALLASLARFIDSFEVVVTFNGKLFDIPLLNARHIMNSYPSPFGEMQHVDLLPVARKLWRNRLPSRALKSLETDILNLPRTDEEVPGWLIPQLYFDYLRSGDARPLAGILYHNAMDILSLAALFNFVSDILMDPSDTRLLDSLDIAAIARIYEEMGRHEKAIALYERSRAIASYTSKTLSR
jgi:uncharacterized protein